MEIKQGASDVPLFIQPRINGVVVTVAQWLAQYGASAGVYTLLAETADKSANQEIVGTPDTNGINFTLPSSLFTVAQRVWTMSLKFVFDGTIIDFALYNFEIKVTKPQSVNTR